MDYFLSHIGTIFIAAIIVSVAAVTWWGSMTFNAYLKRQRAARRRAEAEAAKNAEDNM